VNLYPTPKGVEPGDQMDLSQRDAEQAAMPKILDLAVDNTLYLLQPFW